ncbi:MAG: diacylglycerol kinase family lipid kinase [Ignavibacterium sp.]
MESKSPYLVLNPASAGGKTGRRQKEIIRAVERQFGPVILLLTEKNAAVSAEASDGGVILVSGGDGTIQHVVNAFLQKGSPGLSSPELAILSSGTGCGFAQSLGIPRGLERQVRIAASGRARAIDVGKLEYTQFNGARAMRYFINECQLGIGAEVVRRVEGGAKRAGGRLTFGLATLQSVFRHRNQAMTVTTDGIRHEGTFCGVTVANGPRMGGGMNLVPGASMEDHRLDILIMGDLSVGQRVRAFPGIYSGSHVRRRGFSLRQARHVTIHSNLPVTIAADGEVLGTTPCTIDVMPAAIRVRR